MKRVGSVFGLQMAYVAVAWIAFDLLIIAFGESPWPILLQMMEGTWGTAYGIGQVLFKATPLLFAGVAVDLALRCGLFNIGAEGQLVMASLVVGVLGARLPAGLPSFVAVPLLLIVAAAVGAMWAVLPAWLKVRFGAHEVISAIMMNRLATGAVGYAFSLGLAMKGTVRTEALVPSARIPRLEVIVPAFRGSAASFAVALAVGVALFVGWAFRRVHIAREMTLIGLAPKPCAAEHIPVGRRTMQALAFSGAIAALGCSATVLGYKGYYEEGLGAGAGFGGIAVALLARRNPFGLVAAALLFGTLQQGGLAINAHVPMELMDVLSGIIVLAVAIVGAERKGPVKVRPTAALVPSAPKEAS